MGISEVSIGQFLTPIGFILLLLMIPIEIGFLGKIRNIIAKFLSYRIIILGKRIQLSVVLVLLMLPVELWNFRDYLNLGYETPITTFDKMLKHRIERNFWLASCGFSCWIYLTAIGYQQLKSEDVQQQIKQRKKNLDENSKEISTENQSNTKKNE